MVTCCGVSCKIVSARLCGVAAVVFLVVCFCFNTAGSRCLVVLLSNLCGCKIVLTSHICVTSHVTCSVPCFTLTWSDLCSEFTFVSCTFLHRSLIPFQVSIPKMLLSLSLNPFFTLPIAASFQLTVECHPTHPLIVPVLQPWVYVGVFWCMLCFFLFLFFVLHFNMWTPRFFKKH